MLSLTADAALLGHLGSRLRAYDYRTDRLRRLLALELSDEALLSDVGRYSLFHLATLSRIGKPVAVLFELFLFCGTVTEQRWQLLDPELAGLLTRLGLVEEDDWAVRRGTVSVSEYQGQLFLSDQLFRHTRHAFVANWTQDSCMPPHASTMELLRSAARLDLANDGAEGPRGGSLLDVGCGSGFLSQLAGPRHQRRVGIDLSTRSVGYANANAALNRVDARYMVGDCTTWTDVEPYTRVLFNAPDGATVFAFIGSTLRSLLDRRGVAQLWFDTEVTRRDGSLRGLLRRAIPDRERWRIDIETNADSPFNLSRAMVRERRLPHHSLLAGGPAGAEAYLDGLTERDVLEVSSVVLTVRHRSRPDAGVARV